MPCLPVPFVEHRWVKKGVNVTSVKETDPNRTLQILASLVPGRMAWGHLPRSLKNKRGYGHLTYLSLKEQRPWLVAFKWLASEKAKSKAAAASVSSDSQRPSISKMWRLRFAHGLGQSLQPSSWPKASQTSTLCCKYMRTTGA